jgi:hypothetical protein
LHISSFLCKCRPKSDAVRRDKLLPFAKKYLLRNLIKSRHLTKRQTLWMASPQTLPHATMSVLNGA